MDSAGDSSSKRNVSGFYAQADNIGRTPCPGSEQLPGMTSPASALGVSLRTPSGNLGSDNDLNISPSKDSTAGVTGCSRFAPRTILQCPREEAIRMLAWVTLQIGG